MIIRKGQGFLTSLGNAMEVKMGVRNADLRSGHEPARVPCHNGHVQRGHARRSNQTTHATQIHVLKNPIRAEGDARA